MSTLKFPPVTMHLPCPPLANSTLWLALFVGTAWLSPSARLNANEVDFNRDIRPILSENCFVCHGPDEGTREAELRLDTFAGATADLGGYAAIVPADLESSELWLRVSSDDPDLSMPPAESGMALTGEQIDKLRQWIEAGAEYRSHWSFEPIEQPQLPPPRVDWNPINPIDLFIHRRLATAGLSPSPAADRATLLRRLSLDLRGFPPTIAELDDFQTDKSPNAYEKLVDRMLASPHFGERWGRYWLDQARYADSHGYTNDSERSMWLYRDWVIASLNRDQPFDEFTIEQLAGDLLEDPTNDQIVATGFHRNTLINNEGGTKADQFHDEQTKDRVDTTGVVWMGLTVGCAKCHTHKYDPISLTEYYQLYAFFNSSADNNSVAPTLSLPSDQQRERLAELNGQLELAQSQLKERLQLSAARREEWLQQIVAEQAVQPEWVAWEPEVSSRHGATFTTLDDGSLLAGGANEPDDIYTLTGAVPIESLRGIRLELLTHESLPRQGPGRASNGNLLLTELRAEGPSGMELPIMRAWADHSQPGFDVAKAIDNDAGSGWAINQSPEGGANHNRVAQFTIGLPRDESDRGRLKLTMRFNHGASVYNLGRFRLTLSATAPQDPDLQQLVEIGRIPAAERNGKQQQQVLTTYVAQHVELRQLQEQVDQLRTNRDALRRSFPTTMVMRDRPQTLPAFVQTRGDFLRPAEQVRPNVPGVLPTMVRDDRIDRLDLARWLVDPAHPLTARVRINRIWMRLFGKGLVETEDDFGTQGKLPTHPELLDWLASTWIERQWSTKQLIRSIVLSSTYRQSSKARTDLDVRDPRNIWMARQNRLRVEAEILRDQALWVSGLYADRIGGPSVFPPQPDGVYAFTQVAKRWPTSQGTDRYRRGMYTFFYRTAPHPMLSTFDVPKFNQSCTRRDRSNTPLQALTLANDPALLELARGLAKRTREIDPAKGVGAESVGEEVAYLFRICMARAIRSEEQKVLVNYWNAELQRFESDRDGALAVSGEGSWSDGVAQRAAWVSVARVLMNLDEFVTRE